MLGHPENPQTLVFSITRVENGNSAPAVVSRGSKQSSDANSIEFEEFRARASNLIALPNSVPNG
jgi:hypothetical protein